ncbi:tRNA-guanosine(34) transglycosylase [Candidatus Aerophobetes bacterium]|uniref:Queuine tRNA-ribosyltransferase n=1 Tax=Aerophobetes bacterium TaxID=2030807 RepID=A0A2A4X603_UNCAE|nr:MAG: tRNA-guanosine(34) transglycosylase [Candidatus Aerophobetes bacterium]
MLIDTATFSFEIVHQSKKSRARVGKIHTPHGIINTPNFVAVGTNGTLKSLDNFQVKSIGLELMFCNTYHLMLQPGSQVIKQAGGLHSFIQRDMPIITDSGGFQVFSLAYGSVASELKSSGTKKNAGSVLKINDEGVTFRSYRDGSLVVLTPESSVQAQKDMGADIIIPFDELPPYHIPLADLKHSLDRTHAWEERSLLTHTKNPQGQAMYGVIHGGVNKVLRKKSIDFLTKLPFDGFAIGGSMGKTKEEMLDILTFSMPLLPENKPTHLLGIADLPSLEKLMPLGIDTFDSSYPTKAARHGSIFTKAGPLKITKSLYATDFTPLEESCSCYSCTHYTKAYIHHLFKARELTSLTLASIHNLHFMVEKMKEYRIKILNGDL